MKPSVLIVALVLILGLLAATYDLYGGPQMVPAASPSAAPQTGKTNSFKQSPSFTFTDIDGKERRIEDFRGSVVLLNFWATWCTPCVKEFPALLRLVGSMNGKITLIALSSDRDEDAIRHFLDELKKQQDLADILSSPQTVIALDRRGEITYNLFGTRRFPETVILSPGGAMIQKIVGEIDWNSIATKACLNALAAGDDQTTQTLCRL